MYTKYNIILNAFIFIKQLYAPDEDVIRNIIPFSIYFIIVAVLAATLHIFGVSLTTTHAVQLFYYFFLCSFSC